MAAEANKIHVFLKHCAAGKQTLCSCPCNERAICVDLQLPIDRSACAHAQLYRFSCGEQFIGLCHNIAHLVCTEHYDDLLVWQVACHSHAAKAAQCDRPDKLRAAVITVYAPHWGTAPTRCTLHSYDPGRSATLQYPAALKAAHRQP